MDAFFNANISGFQRVIGQGLTTHLLVLTHFVHKHTMDRLLGSRRFEKLSLAYEGYISLLAERQHSPGELAAQLGISKQACSKTLGELLSLGLVERRGNPRDSRSSLISLTPAGLELLRDGIEATNALHREFADELGEQQLRGLIATLEKLCHRLDIELPAFRALETQGEAASGTRPMRLNVLLPRLSRQFQQTLLDDVSGKGFDGLKASYGQVLGLLSREGRHIQYMASVLGISKQAVASTASELERLGYLERRPDPGDRRQVILSLSPEGKRLLDASVASVDALEASIRTLLSDTEYRLLECATETLYLRVAEQYDAAGMLPAKIQRLSEELLRELGSAGARTLAQQLLSMTRGES